MFLALTYLLIYLVLAHDLTHSDDATMPKIYFCTFYSISMSILAVELS